MRGYAKCLIGLVKGAVSSKRSSCGNGARGYKILRVGASQRPLVQMCASSAVVSFPELFSVP